jgi:hypothetical protein
VTLRSRGSRRGPERSVTHGRERRRQGKKKRTHGKAGRRVRSGRSRKVMELLIYWKHWTFPPSRCAGADVLHNYGSAPPAPTLMGQTVSDAESRNFKRIRRPGSISHSENRVYLHLPKPIESRWGLARLRTCSLRMKCLATPCWPYPVNATP